MMVIKESDCLLLYICPFARYLIAYHPVLSEYRNSFEHLVFSVELAWFHLNQSYLFSVLSEEFLALHQLIMYIFNHLMLINKYDALLMKWCSVYHLWAPSSYCIDNAIYHISNILCIILAGWYCFREAECSVCSSSFRHCYDKFVSY